MLIAVFLVLVGAGAIRVLAVDQMKSTDTLVYSSTAAVTSAVAAPFTLYIGDSLTGVVSPLKSIAFTVGGVYTGSGSLAINIDGDAATSQSFALPSVGATPTPFQLIYRDPSGKINPATAGSYSYTLNMTPAGVTVYNLSALASETHRYAPATCDDGTNEKIKTNEFLVLNATTTISAATTTSFSFYIGDNLAGVVNPMKSLHFALKGVYTGGGSIALQIKGDAATAQTFTLPTVTAPTTIEIIYKDPTNSINPTSAGAYSYTITTTPSGVTLYGLGITLIETHRYKPPTCGGMPIKGELYSAVFDTAGTSTYNSIVWKGATGTPDAGHVRFQLAASNCASGQTDYPTCSIGTWSFVGGATCSSADWFDTVAPDTPYDLQKDACIASWNNKRYFRYAVEICSKDCIVAGAGSPRVDDVIVNWSP